MDSSFAVLEQRLGHHVLSGLLFQSADPQRERTFFQALTLWRNSQEVESHSPRQIGRVGCASPTAHTCLTHAHSCHKYNTRWCWKAPGLTKPDHRLLCRHSRKEPFCFRVPQMAPYFAFITFIPSRAPRPRISPCSKMCPPYSPHMLQPQTAQIQVETGPETQVL